MSAGAWGLLGAAPASAAIPHPTTSTLDCPSTGTYGSPATCTITVRDVIPIGTKKVPTGTVSVGVILDRLDVDGSPCTLEQVSSSASACSVTVTPTDVGLILPGSLYNPSGDFILSVGADIITASAAPLTVTAVDQRATYGSSLPELGADYSGFVLGDGPEDLSGTLSCETTATDSSPAGEYPITCEGLSSSLYDISWVPGTMTIDPAPLTITADDESRLYGASNPTFGVAYAGFVLGEDPSDLTGTLACATTAVTSSSVGAYPISCEGLSSPNYAIDWVAGSLAVTPAPLTVTADDAARVTGQANPTFTADITGFVAGDTRSDLGGTLACTSPAVADSPVGMYAITCSGLTSADYDIAWVPGSLDVMAAPTATVAGSGSLTPGGEVEMATEGWKPDSTVTMSICGTDLGSATADGKGALTTKVSLPDSLPDGECSLVLSGTDAAGQPYAVVLGVTLTRAATPVTPSSGVLPYTGASLAGIVFVGLAGLIGGFVLIAAQRKRTAATVEVPTDERR